MPVLSCREFLLPSDFLLFFDRDGEGADDAFRYFDRNGDGSISCNELQESAAEMLKERKNIAASIKVQYPAELACSSLEKTAAALGAPVLSSCSLTSHDSMQPEAHIANLGSLQLPFRSFKPACTASLASLLICRTQTVLWTAWKRDWGC